MEVSPYGGEPTSGRAGVPGADAGSDRGAEVVLAVFANEDLLVDLVVPGSVFGVHNFTALETLELTIAKGGSFRESHESPLGSSCESEV
jgi:hypothetical protein